MDTPKEDTSKNGHYALPESIPLILGRVIFFLVLFHIVLQAIHYYVYELPWLLREIFDVDEEESFTNWFSTIILFISSVLLFLIAQKKKRDQDPFKIHWYGLAWGFGLLSLDEVAGMHETLNTVTDFAWTIPGAIVVGIVFFLYLKFLLNLPKPMSLLFCIAGSVYVGGAVVVEHLADYYIEVFDMDNFGYQIFTAVEETLEMLGVVFFIRALLIYLVSMLGNEGLLVFHIAGKKLSANKTIES
jgi:uncharacterized membrane protein